MGKYQEISDFYNEHKNDMTSEQANTFKDFLESYDNDADLINEFGKNDTLLLDYEEEPLKAPEITNVDYQHMKQHVRQKVQTREENPLYHYAKDLDGEINNIAKDMLNNLKLTPATQDLDSLPQIDEVYPDKPIVRKRRKQWGGVPTYRNDFDPMKAFAYILRSYRKLMKVSYFTEQDVVSSMRRSISHIYFKEKVTPIRTQEMDLEEALYDAYSEYVNALFVKLQEDTEARKRAWEEYIDKDVVGEMIKETFAPTVDAFRHAEDKLKERIGEKWEDYKEQSFTTRAESQGYKLDEQQVENLQDADDTYMK